MQCNVRSLITYLHNPLKHVSEGEVGYVNVMEAQHAVDLQRTHTTHTQKKHASVNVKHRRYCTSTTLSNMWARGRKEMSTSFGLAFSVA